MLRYYQYCIFVCVSHSFPDEKHLSGLRRDWYDYNNSNKNSKNNWRRVFPIRVPTGGNCAPIGFTHSCKTGVASVQNNQSRTENKNYSVPGSV